MKTLLTLLTSVITTFTHAQPAIEWQKNLGGSDFDQSYSIKETTDGGYIVAGDSYSNDWDVSGNYGELDYWIVKLNSSGALEWEKNLGGSGDDDAFSVQQTTDGGYIVAGYSASNDDDVTGSKGDADYWIVKLSSTGTIEWQKSLGGTGVEIAESIKQTSDGGYIVAGTCNSNNGDVSGNHGLRDYWIVKLDDSGNLVWQKSLGGTGDDLATDIQETTDGGYIVAGYSTSNDDEVSGNQGLEDYWIAKLNSVGTLLWQKSLGGTAFDAAMSIEQTTDGGYIVAGFSDSNNGDLTGNAGQSDFWIVKLDGIGTIEWQKNFGGSNDDFAHSVKQTTDGGYIAAGSSSSNDGNVTDNHGVLDYWIVKLSSGGDLQWQKTLGGGNDDLGSSIHPTNDGGYIVAGDTESNDGDVTGNFGQSDYWVVKLAPDVVLPVTLINLSGEMQGKHNVLHWSTATELNNTGFEIQRSSDEINFSKIGFVNTKSLNGNSNATLNYDFTDILYPLINNYYRLRQIDKDGRSAYSNIIVLRNSNTPESGLFSIYPNPVKNILKLKTLSTGNNKITLFVTDPAGKLLLKKVTNIGNGESIVPLNVAKLSSGTYFLRMLSADGKENAVKKFVIE